MDLNTTYDPALVALSILIAVIFSFAVLTLLPRALQAGQRRPLAWVISGGGALGTGIWATHFTAMMAYVTPFPVHYDAFITFLSLLVAVLVCAIALFILIQPVLSLARWLSSGLGIGLGISSMHYIGMAATRMKPGIEYDVMPVFLSVLIAVTAAWVGHHDGLLQKRCCDESRPGAASHRSHVHGDCHRWHALYRHGGHQSYPC